MHTLHQNIRQLILEARSKIAVVVNFTLVETYWPIGQYIVLYEQEGNEPVEYGKAIVSDLAEQLKAKFGSAH